MNPDDPQTVLKEGILRMAGEVLSEEDIKVGVVSFPPLLLFTSPLQFIIFLKLFYRCFALRDLCCCSRSGINPLSRAEFKWLRRVPFSLMLCGFTCYAELCFRWRPCS